MAATLNELLYEAKDAQEEFDLIDQKYLGEESEPLRVFRRATEAWEALFAAMRQRPCTVIDGKGRPYNAVELLTMQGYRRWNRTHLHFVDEFGKVDSIDLYKCDEVRYAE